MSLSSWVVHEVPESPGNGTCAGGGVGKAFNWKYGSGGGNTG